MNFSDSRSFGWARKIHLRPGLAFAIIILIALAAFEMFNYSTTEFALNDLLGNLKFIEIPWATILSIAFCGIDFAGIARLFTPEQGADEPKEVWYLFGAWLLAATMNAILTWWGVSMAITSHKMTSAAIMDTATLIKVVPVFVAVMVWVIRILIIGTIFCCRRPPVQWRPARRFHQPQPGTGGARFDRYEHQSKPGSPAFDCPAFLEPLSHYPRTALQPS